MKINITSRIRNAMVGLSLALCALFTGLIFLFAYVIEDRIFANQIKLAQEQFADVVATGTPNEIAAWQPGNSSIRRVLSISDVPEHLPASLKESVKNEAGVHEYFDDEYALFISRLQPQKSDSIAGFLIYDVSEILAVRDSKVSLFMLIGLVSLLIAIVATLVANRLTKTTLAPVVRLTSALKAGALDDVIIDLARSFSEDEVSVLTQELAKAFEEVKKTAQREFEFNRGVSHELRSPIQVALASVELLQAQADESKASINKPVERLQRSVAEMSEIAEAFLWLASNRRLEQSEWCSLSQIQKTLRQVQQSIARVRITVSLPDENTAIPHYSIPNSVLAVMLRNLIRNAVMHGDKNEIHIAVEANAIRVSNAVAEAGRSAEGFGVGLRIVEGLCQRFGVMLEQAAQAKNHEVTLRFPD